MNTKISQRDKMMLLVLVLVLICFGGYMLPTYGIADVLENKGKAQATLDAAEAAYDEQKAVYNEATGLTWNESSNVSVIVNDIKRRILTTKYTAVQARELTGTSLQEHVASYLPAREVYETYLQRLNIENFGEETQAYIFFDEDVYPVRGDNPSASEIGYNEATFVVPSGMYTYCFRSFTYDITPITTDEENSTLYQSVLNGDGQTYFTYNKELYLNKLITLWSTVLTATSGVLSDSSISIDTERGEATFRIVLMMTVSNSGAETLGDYRIGICTGQDGVSEHPYDAANPEWQNHQCLWCGLAVGDVELE